MIGIYIHVPFCLRKCPYCDFYSVVWNENAAEEYTQAVVRNIAAYKHLQLEADTIYFGGGTPSLLTGEQLGRIIAACDNSFSLRSPEITVECNPSSADISKLREYKASGVNRLSFGVQSADDKSLQWLGRLHNFEGAQKAAESAARVGFDNISCDLMLGLKGQTERSLGEDIMRITGLPISHVSAYMLKIEEGTAFDCESVRSAAADEDRMCSLYLEAVRLLEELGFMQYEISNFAKDGRESRHNNKYWQGEEYLGFGPAAHSYFKGQRFCCPPSVRDFIGSDIQQRIITDQAPDRAEEYIMLGLRLKKGISLERAEELFGKEAVRRMKIKALEWCKHGLCRLEGDNLRLTPQGFLVSNEIIVRLLEEQ